VITVKECTGPITTFIVEPFVPHAEEYYLSIQSNRLDCDISFCPAGEGCLPPAGLLDSQVPPMLHSLGRRAAKCQLPSPCHPHTRHLTQTPSPSPSHTPPPGGVDIEENWDKLKTVTVPTGAPATQDLLAPLLSEVPLEVRPRLHEFISQVGGRPGAPLLLLLGGDAEPGPGAWPHPQP
jgi:hypothetical protein